MSTTVIDDARTTPQVLSGSDDLLTITRAGNIGVIGDTDIGLLEDAGSSNNTIRVLGQVSAQPGLGAGVSTGISIKGDNTHLIIGASALVTGDYAVRVTGTDARIDNQGDLIGQGFGSIGLYLLSGTATNSGRILGTTGVYLEDGASFTNQSGGEVLGGNVAIILTDTVGSAVVNHGSLIVLSDSFSIFASFGNDRITNDGRIQGSIYLNDGNDLVDNRDGRIIGDIAGVGGNDTLITDKATDILLESAGNGIDTVKSTVSYTLSVNVERLVLLGAKNIDATGSVDANEIYGNAGNNLLRGLDGEDTLAGGRGADVLVGGADSDHFAFRNGDGIDTIRDFEDANDTIYISGFAAIDSFAKLKPLIEKHGDDVWIDFGHGDRLVFADIAKSELGSADFPFPL
jgi:Ca2+-binding RTX toxin-like protein